MADTNAKAEEEKKTELKQSREYKRFKKLLKQVIKAPPLRQKLPQWGNEIDAQGTTPKNASENA